MTYRWSIEAEQVAQRLIDRSMHAYIIDSSVQILEKERRLMW